MKIHAGCKCLCLSYDVCSPSAINPQMSHTLSRTHREPLALKYLTAYMTTCSVQLIKNNLLAVEEFSTVLEFPLLWNGQYNDPGFIKNQWAIFIWAAIFYLGSKNKNSLQTVQYIDWFTVLIEKQFFFQTIVIQYAPFSFGSTVILPALVNFGHDFILFCWEIKLPVLYEGLYVQYII